MPHVLWDRPRVRTKAEIPEECIREDILLKVKDGGKLEPKLFVLTRGKIYYTNGENEDELRGELGLSFVFVEFIDPVEIMDKELNNSIDEDLEKDYPCEDPRNFEIKQTEEDEHEPKKVADLLKLPHHSRHNIAKGSIKTTDFHVHQKIRAEATNIDRENPDHHYLHDLLMSKIPSKMNSYSKANELLVNEKDFDEESIADEQTPLMTIRLISGNKFTEIATHDRHIFLAWKSVLKYYCFQANFHEEYRVDEIIEQKKYSKVYSVQHVRGNHRYTAKTISKDLLARDEVVLEKVRHELCIYKTIHHQNIVKLFEVFEDHLAVTLLFEYICGPTLELSTKAHFPYRNRDMICFSQRVSGSPSLPPQERRGAQRHQPPHRPPPLPRQGLPSQPSRLHRSLQVPRPPLSPTHCRGCRLWSVRIRGSRGGEGTTDRRHQWSGSVQGRCVRGGTTTLHSYVGRGPAY
jgi:hypothetical protein